MLVFILLATGIVIAGLPYFEIHAPPRLRMWAFVAVVILLITSLVMGLLWRQRSVAFCQGHFEAAEKLRYLNEV
ncbi:MAG: hypothetical protein JXO72_04775 [Vicinamibacteria bacterium]|nr:hypothetical protein [Vicinamibacteria bacterium]